MAVELTPDEIARRTQELGEHLWGDGGIKCQCVCDCQEPAVFRIEEHMVGHCNRPEFEPFGNLVHLLCMGCTMQLRAKAIYLLNQVIPAARLLGVPAICFSCGAPIADLRDVIRSAEFTPGGVR